MATIQKNFGAITAYGLAKEAGYTGTKEQFQAGLIESATAAATATQKAQEAAESATAAATAQTASETAKTASESARDDALSYRDQTQALHDSILQVIQIPVGHAYNVGIHEHNNVVQITWSDPVDNVTADGATLAYWGKTRLIYKMGGFPEDENDGTVLVDNTVRNAYHDTPFEFDMGVLSDYYFALFTCTTGGVWNTSDSAPRFELDHVSFATIRQLLRSNIPLSTIGLSVGGVVNIQTSSRFPNLRWRLVDENYHGCELYDSTRTKAAIFIPQYLLAEGDSENAIMSQFDAPELAYAVTDDEYFLSGKVYYTLVDADYVALAEGTDWNAGDSVADWTAQHSADVYSHNNAQRISNGNNNWKDSNRRQWFHATGVDWFEKQNIYDKLSSYADYHSGFLTGFDTGFLELVMPVYNKTARNTIAITAGGYGGGTDVTLDKFWLPSIKEVFGTNNNGIAEGAQFDYFQNIAVSNEDRIQYDEDGTPRYVFLRSANPGSTSSVYYITASGTSSNRLANFAYAVLPAMCIA